MRLGSSRSALISVEFQLTPPLRGATWVGDNPLQLTLISTHTPLAGCDVGRGSHCLLCWYFNSHPPRGVRQARRWCVVVFQGFQLTHPSRGATPVRSRSKSSFIFQLTHPSRGATRSEANTRRVPQFQLTPPSRGATAFDRWRIRQNRNFNSHTPRGVRRNRR